MSMGGDEFLYRFGFDFDTSGFDELLSALESFAQRAESGFGGGAGGGNIEVPAALGEGAVPSGQVPVALTDLSRQLVEATRAGKLTAEQFVQISQVLNRAFQGLGPAAQAAATVRNQVRTTQPPPEEKRPIDRILPFDRQASADYSTVLKAANRAELEQRLAERAGLTAQQSNVRAREEAKLQEALAMDTQYIQAKGEAAAFRRSTTARERAITDRQLAQDALYVEAKAESKNAQRQLSLEIAAEARRQRQSGQFDFTTAEAQDRIQSRREAARVAQRESELLSRLPSVRQDIGQGDAAKRISAAAIDAEEAKALAASKTYTADVAQTAALKQIQSSAIEAQTVELIRQTAAERGISAATLLAQGKIERQALDEEVKLKVIQAQLAVERRSLGLSEQQIVALDEALNAEKISTAAKLQVAKKQLDVARREGAQQGFAAAGFDQSGTRFQRAQALIDLRRNGAVRDPAEYQTLGAFFGQRALNTFGYLTSGIAFYGLFDSLKKAVQETENAQRALQVLRATFEQTDQSGKFDETRKALLDIATETGRLGSETINTFRQLYGALGQNAGAALTATRQSNKFAQVTGLDPKEITDSLTAISLSFNQTDFTPFLDQAIALEGQFGVLASETVQFAADLAPLASQLGFTSQQLESFGAAAQAVSGKTGGALAEQFGRIFEVFTDPTKTLDLAQVIGTQLPDAFNAFTSAIGSGNVEKAFEVILDSLDKLDKAGSSEKARSIRDALVNIAGGPRQAGALAAVLSRPGITLEALQGRTGDPAGALDKRFQEVQASLAQTFERIKRGVEELFQTFLNSGLSDLVLSLGHALEFTLGVATKFLEIFSNINDTFGGLPGQILLTAGAVSLLAKAFTAISELGLLRAFLGIGGARGAAAEAGGFLGFRSAAAPVAEAAAVGTFARPVAGALGGLGPGATSPILGGIESVAGTGAVGAALTSAATLLAPVIAAVLVDKAFNSVQDFRNDAKKGREALDSAVAAELKKGTKPEEILRRVDATGQGHIAPTFAGFNTGPTIKQETLNEIQRQNAPRQQEELAAIEGKVSGEQAAQIRFIAEKFKANPTNDVLNNTVARIIAAAAGGHLGPEALSALQDIALHYDLPPVEQAVQDQQQTLDTALAKLDAGIGSVDEVRRAGEEELSRIDNILNQTRGKDQRKYDQYALLRVKTQKQIDDAITKDIKTRRDRLVSILSVASGQTDPAIAIQYDLQIANNFETSPEDKLQAILDIFENQRKQYEEYVNEAVNAQDKLNRIREGQTKFAFDPKLRAAAIASQLQLDPAAKAISQAGGAIYLAVAQEQSKTTTAGPVGTIESYANAFAYDISKRMVDLGETYKEAATAILEGKKQMLQAVIDAANQRYGVGSLNAALVIVPLQQAIDEANKQIDALNNVQVADPGAGPTTTPTDTKAAEDQARQYRIQLAQAYEDLIAAQSHGDPVAVAQANKRKAEIALANAKDELETVQAQTQLQEAINALEDANNDIANALRDYAQAVTTDPVLAAQYALGNADAAVANAHGEAEKLRAMAERVKAERAVQDAINDVANSQIELLEAYANASGDTVESARLALELAQQKLAQLVAQRPDDTAAINRAKADVINAQAGLRDAELSKKEGDIDFLLQMEKITTQQAIAQFEALLQIPNLTEEQTRQILLKIKELQGQLSRDLQFDIPNEIKLPTIYEVRRLGQAGTYNAGPGPTTITDNRQIFVQFGNLVANNPEELQKAVDVITDAITAPPRDGQYVNPIGGI